MRQSLYWDDFEKRIYETVDAVRSGGQPPVRRVAVFVTEKCNFRCKYCNVKQTPKTLSEEKFDEIVKRYGQTAIIHITGGEPSVVPWLYPYLATHGHQYRFHLNTSAYIMPPAQSIQRLKVSLDSCNAEYWDTLVGRPAFDRVVANIQEASQQAITTITYTLTKENYLQAPEFIGFANKTFPDLYALFFSVYKGADTRYAFTAKDAGVLFNATVPEMKRLLTEESAALLTETLDEKHRLIDGVRFPENDLTKPCYLSMSERVISPDGEECACSHLYRDGIRSLKPEKHDRCRYGCNQRLCKFNRDVELLLGWL